MNNELLTILGLIAIACIVLAIGVAVSRKRQRARSMALREHFGPEYERALEQHGSRARAEKELAMRQRRVSKLDIHELTPEQCARFQSSWAAVQQRFVDDPSGAVADADGLLKQVMSARGYPMGDFDQRVADLSVEHGPVVQHYRAARDAYAKANDGATTEDLRQAMVHYTALFTDLVQRHESDARGLREAQHAHA